MPAGYHCWLCSRCMCSHPNCSTASVIPSFIMLLIAKIIFLYSPLLLVISCLLVSCDVGLGCKSSQNSQPQETSSAAFSRRGLSSRPGRICGCCPAMMLLLRASTAQLFWWTSGSWMLLCMWCVHARFQTSCHLALKGAFAGKSKRSQVGDCLWGVIKRGRNLWWVVLILKESQWRYHKKLVWIHVHGAFAKALAGSFYGLRYYGWSCMRLQNADALGSVEASLEVLSLMCF